MSPGRDEVSGALLRFNGTKMRRSMAKEAIRGTECIAEVLDMRFSKKELLDSIASGQLSMSVYADLCLGRCHFPQARIRCPVQVRNSRIRLAPR